MISLFVSGKDLSKISMPVTLNEPLSALQRLCEELEYVELVEKALRAAQPLERLQWVVAFAVSAYGSCNARASQKPFNPLLGETYECVRDDMGFRQRMPKRKIGRVFVAQYGWFV